MSYRRSGLGIPGVAPTTYFAGGIAPYAARSGPAGAVYAPYGWGPDFMIGMPLNYTHHIDYVTEPGFSGTHEQQVAQQWTESPCHSPGLFRHANESCAIWKQQMAEAQRADRANANRAVPGARPIGPMRDTLGMGCYESGPYEGDSQSLGSYEVDPANASNGVLPQRRRDGMGDSGDGLGGL